MTTKVFNKGSCGPSSYGGLGDVSIGYPPVTGMSLTRYAPLRRSPASIAGPAAPRLACVKPAASVHPEPGSNSSLYIHILKFQFDPDSFILNKNQRSRFKKFSVLACTNLSLFSKNFVLEIIPTPSIPLKGDDQRLSARRQAGPTGGIFKELRCF